MIRRSFLKLAALLPFVRIAPASPAPVPAPILSRDPSSHAVMREFMESMPSSVDCMEHMAFIYDPVGRHALCNDTPSTWATHVPGRPSPS